jgi:dihydrofolate synthase/folylpolyglutamate synthase
VDALAAVAADLFGEDRVRVAPTLPEALDLAIGLVDDPLEVGGTGVLVTGSVVTAGEARLLLAGS